VLGQTLAAGRYYLTPVVIATLLTGAMRENSRIAMWAGRLGNWSGTPLLLAGADTSVRFPSFW
jgi:hypothetical protein